MSMRAIIESIEREMLGRATREENAEMIDATNLEDDSDNVGHYIKGRNGCENETRKERMVHL